MVRRGLLFFVILVGIGAALLGGCQYDPDSDSQVQKLEFPEDLKAEIESENKTQKQLRRDWIRNNKNADTSDLMAGMSPLLNTMSPPENAKVEADRLINENIFVFPVFGDYDFGPDINWFETDNRSFLRLVHGHVFLPALVSAYKETQDPVYIMKGFAMIREWILENPYDPESMAWHDEATALRLMKWIVFFDGARNVLKESQLQLLMDNIIQHQHFLAHEDFYAEMNNHGMFQDQALLLSADYFHDLGESGEFRELAVNRLIGYFEGMISADGVHYENSPAYHTLIAEQAKGFADYFQETDGKNADIFMELYDRTMKYSTFLVKPDGFYPQIGDTENLRVPEDLYEKDPFYLYAATAGEKGVAPGRTDAVFMDPGYAVFRDSWDKKEKATYLFFSAAYKSRAHKHGDDLSLWIYSDGDIITEAGGYGYNTEDDFTSYGYSSFAHNTLVVDDQGLSRTDDKYGKTYLRDYSLGETVSAVSGVNDRYDGVSHKRQVEFDKPRKYITVTDEISSITNHRYQLSWHLAPDIQPVLKEDQIFLYRGNDQIGRMEILSGSKLSISIVRGQTEPAVQGWLFKKFYEKQPTSVILINFAETNATVTTIFDIEQDKGSRD